MYQFPDEMRKAYENSPLSFVYYQAIDGLAVPILASEGFCRNTGMDREHVLEWLQAGMFQRMHPDDAGIMVTISDDFLRQRGPYDAIFRCRLERARPGDTEDGYALIHGFGNWQTMPDGTELAVICYINMSQTRESMITFKQSYTLFQRDRFYNDPLTGLPNINYLHEFAGEKVDVIRAEGGTPAVVYSDVYSMQSYNNQYGFKEGDALLMLITAVLRERFPDALLVRGADDHFVMILALKDMDALTSGLRAVNDTIKRQAKGNTSGLRSGICEMSEGVEFGEALDHARHAMKDINNDMTRTSAIFSRASDDLYWKRRYIIENFDRALSEGWIKVYYQGIFRAETRKIAAFEALARWVDPIRGTISPGEFIPVLQRYHQVYKLDLFMLEQVCREIPLRRDNGLPLVPVSVNFSRQDFDHADIPAEMNALYEKYGLESCVGKDYFIVEITEQDVAIGAEGFRSQLKRIRENGYKLWLDDFGSGYSSISMFSQFEFDLIKYDMELLRHLDDHGGANRIILKELVYVANQLGLHTLAEGLEDERQLAFLKEIGCELVQGFYFYRPEPLDEILFRIRGGMIIKPCETAQERISFERKQFDV